MVFQNAPPDVRAGGNRRGRGAPTSDSSSHVTVLSKGHERSPDGPLRPPGLWGALPGVMDGVA
jgi:hypothetical protein